CFIKLLLPFCDLIQHIHTVRGKNQGTTDDYRRRCYDLSPPCALGSPVQIVKPASEDGSGNTVIFRFQSVQPLSFCVCTDICAQRFYFHTGKGFHSVFTDHPSAFPADFLRESVVRFSFYQKRENPAVAVVPQMFKI